MKAISKTRLNFFFKISVAVLIVMNLLVVINAFAQTTSAPAGATQIAGAPTLQASRVTGNLPPEELREYVDPIEQVIDWFNVIHWAMGDGRRGC